MSRITIPEGWVDTASWLIFLQGDEKAVERYLFSPELTGEDYQRCLKSFLALQHLTMHFWHAISTSFLFLHSGDYLALCLQAVGDFAHSKKRYSDVPFRKFEQEFAKLIARLQVSDAEKTDWIEAAEAKLRSGSWHRWERTEPVPSFINALQVIEGCAVLCSYRLCYPSPSHEDFLHYLHLHYPDQSLVPSGGAYLLAEAELGELAFDLFSPACYLALHTEDPGHNLDAILLNAKKCLKSASREQIIDDPLTFLLNTTDMREDYCFPLTMKYAMSQGSRVPFHPILQPYVERIAQAADDLRVCDFFARPYFYGHYSAGRTMQLKLKESKLKEFLVDILPPARVYSEYVSHCLNDCLTTGLGKDLGNEYIQKIADLTAIVRLAERLVFGKSDLMLCPHQNCPVHKTGLCQGYFAFPPDDFKRCEFPELLKDLKLQSLLESIPI